MPALLKQHNISSSRAKNPDEEPQTEDIERCHALKATISPSSAYIIYYGASNHMVSSKEFFYTLSLTKGMNIHMGDDSQIPAKGRGLVIQSMVSSRMYYMFPPLFLTCYLFIK